MITNISLINPALIGNNSTTNTIRVEDIIDYPEQQKVVAYCVTSMSPFIQEELVLYSGDIYSNYATASLTKQISKIKYYYENDRTPISEFPNPDEPDWEGLRDRALGGDLNPIFQRLTLVSLDPAANAISTARGDIGDAIMTVKIEAALASGLYMLTQIAGYEFTQEEKDLWQAAVDELGFSSVVYLP